MRVGALQDWPEFGTRASRSASRRAEVRIVEQDVRRFSAQFLMDPLDRGAAFLATSVPARVEPVNETMSMSGCEASGAPTPGPSPMIMLNTPAGTPASCMTLVQRIALKGEYLGGFQHHGAARGERRRHLGGDLVHRPVPRRDQRANADRLLHQPGLPRASSNWKLLAPRSSPRHGRTPIRVCEPLASEIGAPISVEIACAISS